MGLGLRAGGVVVGSAGVRARLQRGEIRLVVVAADRSVRTRQKVERLAAARGIPVVVGPPAASFGARLGRGPVQAVGVRDPHLAAGILAAGRQQEG